MKKLLLACASLLTAVASYGQGQVVFANTATTLFTTNSPTGVSGNMFGANQWRIGLYTAAPGTTDPSLFTLIAVATNSPIAQGRFSHPEAPYTIVGNNGTPIAFQVRAWAASGGQTYEGTTALTYRGVTAIGSVTPAVGGAPAPGLFGTGPGQLASGVVLTAIPEPSSIALGLLGLGAIALFRRRK